MRFDNVSIFGVAHLDAPHRVPSEEIEELKVAAESSTSSTSKEIEEEIGDMLFTIVNIARAYGVHPEIALIETNEKFRTRFRYVERRMAERGEPLSQEKLSLMDESWEESKKRRKS